MASATVQEQQQQHVSKVEQQDSGNMKEEYKDDQMTSLNNNVSASQGLIGIEPLLRQMEVHRNQMFQRMVDNINKGKSELSHCRERVGELMERIDKMEHAIENNREKWRLRQQAEKDLLESLEGVSLSVTQRSNSRTSVGSLSPHRRQVISSRMGRSRTFSGDGDDDGGDDDMQSDHGSIATSATTTSTTTTATRGNRFGYHGDEDSDDHASNFDIHNDTTVHASLITSSPFASTDFAKRFAASFDTPHNARR